MNASQKNIGPSSQKIIQIKHDQNYIHQKGIRNIFYNVPFDDYEQNAIQNIKKHQKFQNISYFIDDAQILKLLYSANFKEEMFFTNLDIFIEYQVNQTQFCFNEKLVNYFKNGIIYQLGRDFSMRPIIIINLQAAKFIPMNDLKEIIVYFIQEVQDQLCKYYYIENCIFFIDVNQVNMFDFSIKEIGKIFEFFQIIFVGIAHLIYILNVSSGLEFSWNAISTYINDKTQNKIHFVKSSNLDKLKETINPINIEKKYGGKHSNIEVFWPLVFSQRSIEKSCLSLQMSQNSKIIKKSQKISLKNINESGFLFKNGTDQPNLIQPNNSKNVIDIDLQINKVDSCSYVKSLGNDLENQIILGSLLLKKENINQNDDNPSQVQQIFQKSQYTIMHERSQNVLEGSEMTVRCCSQKLCEIF